MTRRALAGVLAAAAAAVGSLVTATPAAAAGGYTITVHIAPATPHVGDTLTVSGIVRNATTGDPAPGVALQIVRTDRSGTQTPFPTTTGTGVGMDLPAGEYSRTDPMPAVRATVTYSVTPASPDGSEGHASVFVYRKPTTLTIKAGRSIVRSGRQVRVTAHLGSTDTNRTVAIYARPYRLDRHLVRRATVDPTTGNLSATPYVHRRTTFIAKFAGDNVYARATATVVVRARALVTERLHGGYGTDGAYRLYHAGGIPVLSAHLHPELDDVCLWFKAQRRSNGSWHTVASRCFRTDASGRARAEFNNALFGSRYRVRARWRGSKVAAAAAGPWLHLRIQ